MKTKQLLIISDNNLERTGQRTINILRKSGYIPEFARGPHKIEEMLLQQNHYFIVWDIRISNMSLINDIAKIINQFDVAGLLFIAPISLFSKKISDLIHCGYAFTDSFDRPAELLQYLSGKIPLAESVTHYGFNDENNSTGNPEKDFIGMFSNQSVNNDSEPVEIEPSPVKKKFANWNPTENIIKDELSSTIFSPPKGLLQKIKSFFKSS